jgi:hypothetical protein
MGATRDNFVKYPRTPHLFGSTGTDDDKHMGETESLKFVADPSLIAEEKLDGGNCGLHFLSSGKMVLQCRGHEITAGMHPQWDLFKQWVQVKRPVLENMLGSQYILYGEWLYAKHSVHYRGLISYFFEFDIWDKDAQAFLDLESRLILLEGTNIQTVPVIHRGAATLEKLKSLIGVSAFDSQFQNPATGRTDNLMEGIYLRTEADGFVTGRAKLVRPEFVEKVKQSPHWKEQAMVPNQLAAGANIWA